MVLLQKQNAVLYQLALVATMLCPLLAVLLVQKVFLRQPTGIGWKVQGKRRYWLAAWFGPAVFTVLAAVLYFAVFPHRLDLSGSWLTAPTAARWTLRPAQGAGRIQPQLHAGNRSVCGHAGSGHQYVRSFGRGSRMARGI
mgnify:FL=1